MSNQKKIIAKLAAKCKKKTFSVLPRVYVEDLIDAEKITQNRRLTDMNTNILTFDTRTDSSKINFNHSRNEASSFTTKLKTLTSNIPTTLHKIVAAVAFVLLFNFIDFSHTPYADDYSLSEYSTQTIISSNMHHNNEAYFEIDAHVDRENNVIEDSETEHLRDNVMYFYVADADAASYESEPCEYAAELISASSSQQLIEYMQLFSTLSIDDQLGYVVPDGMIYYNVPLERHLQEFLWYQSKQREVPFELALAVMHYESTFRYWVRGGPNRNGTFDYGLMQINQVNHERLRQRLGITDFLCPYDNIIAGVYILAEALSAGNGCWHRGLMAYNMGIGGMRRSVNNGTYTTAYSRRVIAFALELKPSSFHR